MLIENSNKLNIALSTYKILVTTNICYVHTQIFKNILFKHLMQRLKVKQLSETT